MKVVIFCGGLGVRMGEATQRIPKPMIPIGTQPILWHLMKWYASWGHREFILCLGYRAESVKKYFLSYEEALANDFVLADGGREVRVLSSDISDWRITFVDTGVRAEIGQRLKAVEPYLEGDATFLATYGDALTDAPLDEMIALHERSGKTALLMSVRPRLDYHLLRSDSSTGLVLAVQRLAEADVRINGGFFVFRREIFDVIGPGEDLVEEPFARLIERGDLLAYPYDGFWEPMDTIKDKQKLDAIYEAGQAPWLLGPSRGKACLE
ncbi:MAG: glucose-1-phosphate cytidylyltransferase [Gaiellaceae bacterium]|jgi:glucose-1-phosphate cytidylyltransferase|nr:MAG: glucose-1-phosphate cytidylyltransferase [Gaiellaceae bacterium]